MSRAERRQYQRSMRGVGAGRAPSPQMRQRRPIERGAPASRARIAPPASTAPAPLDRRFWTWTLICATLAGLLLLSLSWPQGVPASLYWGVGAAAVWVVAAVAIRLFRRRQRRAA